jgi:hypothetical protein
LHRKSDRYPCRPGPHRPILKERVRAVGRALQNAPYFASEQWLLGFEISSSDFGLVRLSFFVRLRRIASLIRHLAQFSPDVSLIDPFGSFGKPVSPKNGPDHCRIVAVRRQVASAFKHFGNLRVPAFRRLAAAIRFTRKALGMPPAEAGRTSCSFEHATNLLRGRAPHEHALTNAQQPR